MVRVCVVGGGTAGSAAAAEALGRGADVTVVEREERADPPWSHWPELLAPPGQAPEVDLPGGRCEARTLVAEARAASGGSVATSRGEVRYDALVLATGSLFERPAFRGSRLPGVSVLDSPQAYESLGRDAAGSVIVAGEGWRSLQVAEKVARGDRAVKVVASNWRGGRPSRVVLDVLSDAGAEREVDVVSGPLAAAMGAGKVEAAILGEGVVPCDSLAFVPRRLPRQIPTMALVGPLGGVVVDRTLRSSDPAVYAAGGCAELAGPDRRATLEGEPWSSGRLAGSNCLGAEVGMGPSMAEEVIVFGLRYIRLTTADGEGTAPPAGSRSVGRRWGRGTACEITFGPSTKVSRIELAVGVGQPLAGRVPLSAGATLNSLAYDGLGSTNISLVSETARLGLDECRRS